MKMIQINWIHFTTPLSSRIIKDAIAPLDSKDCTNVLIINDSMFERNRSQKVELLAKAYDHANQIKHGLLTLHIFRSSCVFLYLTAVIDWHSRCIVGWEVDDTLDTRMVISTLKKAFNVAKEK